MNARLIALLGTMCLALAFAGCGKDKAAGKKGKPAKSGKSGKSGKPGKSGGYAEGAVDNGGTISGTISYGGTQTDTKLKLTKDNSVCGEGEVQGNKLIVADGKLANAIVALEGVSKGKAWANGSPTVDNAKCRFEPHVSIGQKGAELSAKNSDSVLHNTHLYLKKGSNAKNLKNIALPNQGQTLTYKMKKSGLMDVRCDAHEWMQAWVWVSEHPYVAVTGADGKFSMGDVPAGEYKVKIWHETLGEASATAKVDAGGNATVDHTFN